MWCTLDDVCCLSDLYRFLLRITMLRFSQCLLYVICNYTSAAFPTHITPGGDGPTRRNTFLSNGYCILLLQVSCRPLLYHLRVGWAHLEECHLLRCLPQAGLRFLTLLVGMQRKYWNWYWAVSAKFMHESSKKLVVYFPETLWRE